jgi:hypothetical protein
MITMGKEFRIVPAGGYWGCRIEGTADDLAEIYKSLIVRRSCDFKVATNVDATLLAAD